ncbi:hypothetical protein D9613_003218 [Agrocybe pediades]|uniref:Uncharacterized protein n=1 Tax=Agrocybe pediades TaxID=84607 RepID=A0A8H4VNL5_9AGAR|nr:hypothetical protein D9613_003218 [Agrocybe pediades]
MSTYATEPPRPAMRRKSSAQNLLTSIMSNQSSSSSSSVPPPLNLSLASSSTMNSTSLSFSSVATPTASTPLVREWDAQSLHSDTVSSSMAGAQSPPLGQGQTSTSVEYLRDIVQKRVITLTYLRNIHEGRSHWFHTIQISRAELDRAFNNNNPSIKRRTQRFAILGLSLSTLLDINQPSDLLRGLINTITEYDQSKEENDNKPKMRLRLKSKNPKKGAAGIPEYAGSYTDTADTSFLLVPSIPFPLDYHQTLLSLLDVLSEVYNKISKLLGPSPFPHSSQHMMGPLGMLSPHPGVSYLFSSDSNATQLGGLNNNASQNSNSNPNLHQPMQGSNGNISSLQDFEMSGSLWGIAHAGSNSSGSQMVGGVLSSPPIVGWNNTLGEMVLKIDNKLKKITSVLLKELDELARAGIKDELASLDPLLRSLGGEGTGITSQQLMYDFEGM